MKKSKNTTFSIKFTFEKIRQAIEWFKKKIIQLHTSDKGKAKVDSEKLLKGHEEQEYHERFEIGKMYLFHYDPKYKKQLKYYDTYPLIILTKIVPGGFYGINFHYLPVIDRLKLISLLIEKSVIQDEELDRLLISHGMLANSGGFYRAYEPCFKKYLLTHVQSTIKTIPTNEWALTLALPIESFKKANKYDVWEDSEKYYS